MARQRGPVWQADILYDKQRQRKSFPTQQEAEAWEEAVRKAEVNGLPLPDPSQTQKATLRDSVDQYFESIWPYVKRKDYAREQIDHVMRYIGPNTLVCEIDTKVIIKMEQQFRADDRAESTINRKRSSISKERGNQERILSMAEEKELLGYLKHIGLLLSYHLTNFLLYTGCRLGEAMSLQWSALKISDTRVTFIRTKNDKAWTIPLAKKARAAIEFARREGFERPFVIPRDTYRDHFNRARHRLGFQDGKEFVIHMLRHTCLSRLVEKAVQLLIVKEWAGHNTNGTKD